MARILIVEDNDILNKAYELILVHNGHEVASAYDGIEGLAQAISFNPELILLDMLMPNLDGVGFLKAFDSVHKHPSVKIIMLTNISEESLVAPTLELGAKEYFVKATLAPEQLISVINRQLGDVGA